MHESLCVCLSKNIESVLVNVQKKSSRKRDLSGETYAGEKILSSYLSHIFLDFSFAKLQYLLSLKKNEIAFGNSICKSYSTT